MLTTLVISFREFLEVFLLIGVFLGISKKIKLAREKEIIAASSLGIAISLTLPTLIFLIGDRARLILNEKNADLLGAYLMIFSGFFVAYVVFSLHNLFVLKRSKLLITAHQKMQQNIFDASLFLLIVIFIIREGFEIALFTATTSLFSKFVDNFIGLLGGFAASSLIGFVTFFTYVKYPIGKLFKYTEYFIIILGATFVKNGFSQLLSIYLNIKLADILPLSLPFLPDTSSFVGHLLENLFGLSQYMGLVELFVMFVYISLVYFVFLKKE